MSVPTLLIKSRHTRESGYPVRRGFAIDPNALEYWGSSAFADDDAAGVVSLCSTERRITYDDAVPEPAYSRQPLARNAQAGHSPHP
jgi:hypothetical protein